MLTIVICLLSKILKETPSLMLSSMFWIRYGGGGRISKVISKVVMW